MQLYIDSKFDKDFVAKYLPYVALAKMISVANHKNIAPMNNYLKQEYSITLEDVLHSIKFSINKYGRTYCLSIDNNIIEEKSQEKLITLVKLIEYGNLNVKGLYLVKTSFNYIRNHLNEIYMSYVLKGGK